MSLVSLRPTPTEKVKLYGDCVFHLRRVKPRLSWLPQRPGRSTLKYLDRFQLDTYYTRKWSVRLDPLILTRTLSTVVGKTGAF